MKFTKQIIYYCELIFFLFCSASKYSSSIQKRIINHNLSKVLKPKNAVSILQELKPGSSFKIIQSVKGNSPLFIAYVEHSNSIIATGEGTSKSEAKNVAAENVLKTILTETLSDNPMNQVWKFKNLILIQVENIIFAIIVFR